MHSCDNKRCINPEHLSLGTIAQNVKDEWNRGLAAFGVSLPQSKLTPSAIKDIRKSYTGVRGQKTELGRKYGVCFGTVAKVLRSETWKHVN